MTHDVKQLCTYLKDNQEGLRKLVKFLSEYAQDYQDDEAAEQADLLEPILRYAEEPLPKPHIKLCIHREDDAEAPRWEPLTKFVTWCDGYTIGDEQPKESPDEWLRGLLNDEQAEKYEQEDEEYPAYRGDYGTLEYHNYYAERDKYFRNLVMDWIEERYYLKTVSAYIHSGITISTGSFSCPWDSGAIGYIILEKEVAEKEGIKDPEGLLENEIKVYDQYLQGAVWWYSLTKWQTNVLGQDEEVETVDTCCGFYGDELQQTGIDDNVMPYLKDFVGEKEGKRMLEAAWDARYDD